MQLGCIQCGLCIDACDTVMAKVGREPGLIGYDTDMNIARRQEGKPAIYRIVRPRTVLYAALIVIIGGIMAYTLANRAFQGVSVLHDRNPLYVTLSDGGARNGYTVRLINKRPHERHFALTVSGLPEGFAMEAQGVAAAGGKPVVTVPPDTTREVRVLVMVPGSVALPASTPIDFYIVDTENGEKASTSDFFRAKPPG